MSAYFIALFGEEQESNLEEPLLPLPETYYTEIQAGVP
jgi:hypothetical protein